MMMRRFAEHLRQQQWTSVLIELVIVVLGVFIAIQVSNWNEARRDRALAHQYLERLHEDFALSATGAEASIETMGSRARSASLMLERLAACQLEEGQRADFASGIYVLGRVEPHMLVRGTIDELSSTGRIGIISNLNLRRALSDVLQQQERSEEVLGYIVARRTVPLAYIDARSTFLVSEENMRSAQLKPGEIVFDFPALCNDQPYINAVSHLRQSAYVVIGQNRRLLEAYRSMLKLLEAELAKGEP